MFNPVLLYLDKTSFHQPINQSISQYLG